MRNKKAYDEYCRKLGDTILGAFSKSLSHPWIRLDMCPEFGNLLVLTFGRFVYKFMTSKQGKKLWKDSKRKS